MTAFAVGQTLPVVEVVAHNYAEESTNRIHSDEVASQYGFRGGLVPGVGDYAYMTQPVVEALGSAWLATGSMTAKFLKPVYDGETVTIQCNVTEADPVCFGVELHNAEDTVCAVGTAGMNGRREPLAADNYPVHPLPAMAERRPATAASLPAGTVLGSLEFTLDLAALASSYPEKVRDPLPIYQGPAALCHPSYLLEQANQILAQNVDLGPWIHTGSQVQHYGLARDGDTLSLRGRVADSYIRRGHDFAVLELALFAGDLRPIAHVKHTAVIRLGA